MSKPKPCQTPKKATVQIAVSRSVSHRGKVRAHPARKSSSRASHVPQPIPRLRFTQPMVGCSANSQTTAMATSTAITGRK